MPAPHAKARAGLLLLAALHACARVDVAAAQTAEEAEELFRAGNSLWDAGKYAEARAPYLRAATEFQHAGSQFQLGQIHFYEHGVVANKTEGVRWWKLSSAQGYDITTAFLGFAFTRGDGGLAVDEDEAVRLYTLGVARGEMYALNNLGFAHQKGLGPLAASEPKSLGFYEGSARQGCSGAQFNTAALLYDGLGGVAQNHTMAYFWGKLAATGGDESAKKNLPNFQAQCTDACRKEAEALIAVFKVQDACAASLFNRANFCSGSGTPTPE